ncbi:MAG: large conductance mechanosensitive channel protein MscL [Pirellulales bacterium]|nr:large conductance mechanosensitive channel protein MscL [Pirellulales bacterium]
MSIGRKLESFEPAKRVGTLLDEFKAFAFKGNVIDLAVGVIIGAAFGAIVKSLTDNIIMPLISALIPGDQRYEKWVIPLSSGKEILIGKFIGEILNFLIVAFALFIFIKKFLGWVLHSRQEEAVASPPPMTKDQELLTEIRDLLKTNS